MLQSFEADTLGENKNDTLGYNNIFSDDDHLWLRRMQHVLRTV